MTLHRGEIGTFQTDLFDRDAREPHAHISHFDRLGGIGPNWFWLGFGVEPLVDNEIPTGTIDGTNDTFTIANDSGGTEHLYKNGLRQTPGGVDYTYSVISTVPTIVFVAGNIPQPGDNLIVDYRY